MDNSQIRSIIEASNIDIQESLYSEKHTFLVTNPSNIISLITLLKEQAGFEFLLDITAIDYSEYKADKKPYRFYVVYQLRHKDWLNTCTVKAPILDAQDGIDSILLLFKAADWLERETWDQYGINFKGHPNLKRLLNHHQFVGHPLRKDYPIQKGQLCTETDNMYDQMTDRMRQKGLINSNETCEDKDVQQRFMFLNLGPSHPATHGTLRNFCALDGETIVTAVSEIGYLHRGFEKSCENHTYNQIIPYTDRLNYCSPIANNVAFSKTIEEMLGVTIPDRAIFIRVMVTELMRITDHLVCLAANLVDLGALTNFFYLFAPKEAINELMSKLTGARLTSSYTRIGGLSQDIYDGFLDDLEIVLQKVEKSVGDALTLIEHNRIFQDRTQNICAVSAQEAINLGFSGPHLRASGVQCDMRVNNPYYYYDSFDFDMAVGSVGDTYDRMMVRFEEIRQSVKIIRQASKKLPGGPIIVPDFNIALPPKQQVYNTIEGVMNQFKLIFEGVKVPAMEHYGAIEAANGELGFFVVSDGSGTPYKVKVRAPSMTMMAAFPSMIEGHMIADAVIALGSINIIAGELDR
ncbi:MAG: hypothetical protein RL154_152 [Pseudomonadota bacterium]